MITTLLFDLDGVLVKFDSTKSKLAFIKLAMQEMFKTYGFRKSYLAMTAAKAAMEENGENHFTNEVRAIQAFAKALELSPEAAAALYQQITGKIFPQLREYFYPIDEAQSFVYWAKDKYQCYLTTNPLWPKEMAINRLRWGNIEPSIFKEITHYSNMHFAKPHASYYQEVIKNFSLNPAEVLMIGDSFKKDAPATQLGIKTFILAPKLDKKFKEYYDVNFLSWGNYHDLKIYIEQGKYKNGGEK